MGLEGPSIVSVRVEQTLRAVSVVVPGRPQVPDEGWIRLYLFPILRARLT